MYLHQPEAQTSFSGRIKLGGLYSDYEEHKA